MDPADFLAAALDPDDDTADELTAEEQARLDRVLPTLKLLEEELGRRPLPLSRGANPRYALRRLHAMGGVGEVWLATDTVLGREVALKELRPDRTAHPGLQERLLQEARVTSRLQHPGVVPVYELAEDPADGDPFFTMRFVRGRTLAEAIAHFHAGRGRGGRAVELVALLNAFLSACQTVAYAHSKGVVHRDLKTENVLVGDYGEVVVIDWGFAKVRGDADDPHPAGPTDSGPAETAAGATVGTPVYMAPEQATGGRVDERSDVYGLGAILYEILTGRPPYSGQTAADVIRQVRDGPPPRPEVVAPAAPPGLAAVCLKAIARDPDLRYPTADAVARDVQRWLADEPPTAYREPAAARLARFARRNRTAVAAVLALALASAGGATAVGVSRTRAALAMAAADNKAREDLTREQDRTAKEREQVARQRTLVEQERGRAETARDQAERQRYLFLVSRAERELRGNNPAQSGRLLDQCPADLRGWEWYCLRRLTRAEPLILRGHADGVRAVAFRPGRSELASVGFEHAVRVWDLATGTTRLTLAGHTGFVSDVAYSPDGTRLATGGWDGKLIVRRADDGRVLFTATHGSQVHRVRYSPDGRTLLSFGNSGQLRVWDADTGRENARYLNTQSVVTAGFGPDGHVRAVTTGNGRQRLMDLTDGLVLAELSDVKHSLRWDHWNAAGALLAWTGGDHWHTGDNTVSLTDAASGEPSRRLAGHSDMAIGVAFSPDGKRLASAGMDHTVRVWDPATGDEMLTLVGHTNVVRAVGFSPDGRWLASGGDDRTVRVWDAAPLPEPPPRYQLWASHHPAATGVAWAGDGIASVGSDRAVRVWDPETGQEVAKFALPEDSPSALAASPDGERLAVSALNAVVLDRRTGKVTTAIPKHGYGHLLGIAFSPGGTRVATAGWDRVVEITNTTTGKPAGKLTGHTGPVGGVAYSPDGTLVASAGWDEAVRVYDAGSGSLIRVLTGLGGRGGAVAFGPDSRLLAAAGADGTAQLWDVVTGDRVATLRGHAAAVHGLAFRPDGRVLATASGDTTVKLWRLDPDGPTEWRTLRGHGDQVRAVAFGPGGRRLVSSGLDGTVRVWNVTDEVPRRETEPGGPP